ncbi:hypothetical protein RRG08_036597 [Elysia crispata]|uniref:Uncharacterized protein n=1 Tax=Elysia crispata TaxID=231223 RepID=A0AAE0ZSS2_9GAST|nr:hypothetical protein RRG08_036597 [Elysia crispata]
MVQQYRWVCGGLTLLDLLLCILRQGLKLRARQVEACRVSQGPRLTKESMDKRKTVVPREHWRKLVGRESRESREQASVDCHPLSKCKKNTSAAEHMPINLATNVRLNMSRAGIVSRQVHHTPAVGCRAKRLADLGSETESRLKDESDLSVSETPGFVGLYIHDTRSAQSGRGDGCIRLLSKRFRLLIASAFPIG